MSHITVRQHARNYTVTWGLAYLLGSDDVGHGFHILARQCRQIGGWMVGV